MNNVFHRIAIVIIFAALAAAVLPAASALAQEPVLVRVAPAAVTLAPGATADVAVEVVAVEGLYGFDIRLSFDPAVVEVVDADPAKPGVQVSLGRMLDPGMAVRESADNATGVVHYAMTQLNPSEAKSGAGNLIVVKLRGKAAGSSDLTITSVDLARRDATAIPTTLQHGVATVAASAAALPVNTPIPTQAPPTIVPTGLPPAATATPGSQPTATMPAAATETPAPSATPVPSPTLPSATDTPAPSAEPSAEPAAAAATPAATLPAGGEATAATSTSAPVQQVAASTPAPEATAQSQAEVDAAPQPTATQQAVAAAAAAGDDADAAPRAAQSNADDAPARTLLTVGVAALLAALAITAILGVLLMRRRGGSA